MQLASDLEEYGIRLVVLEGRLPYSALGGAKFIPYKVTGDVKILMPGSQLPNITPILP